MKTGDLAALAIMVAFAGDPAPALATAKIYDMSPLIAQPHPWQPVVPVAYRPQPSARLAIRAPAPRAAVAMPSPARGRDAAPNPPRAVRQVQQSGHILRQVGRLSAELRPQVAERSALTPQRSELFGVPAAGRYFMSGSIGFGFLSDATNSDATVDIESEHEIGFNVTGALGFRFQNGIRSELEIAYRQFGVDNLTLTRVGSLTGLAVGGFDAEGDASALAFMANIAYDFPAQLRIVPHVMAGVGPALVSLSGLRTLGVDVADDSDWVLAFQLGLGAGYPVTDRWLVGAEYRWFATTDPSFEDVAGDSFESEFSSHNFSLVARHTF